MDPTAACDARHRRGGHKKQLYHHRREIKLKRCFVVDAPSYRNRHPSFLGERPPLNTPKAVSSDRVSAFSLHLSEVKPSRSKLDGGCWQVVGGQITGRTRCVDANISVGQERECCPKSLQRKINAWPMKYSGMSVDYALHVSDMP